MPVTTRRFFLQAAGALTATAVLRRSTQAADVNSQIRVGVVGCNGRGRTHISAFRDQLVALCDCDAEVLAREVDKFERNNDRKVEGITDFRRLLERSDVDAISIATPNHTHSLIAILALQAGKDVYCEKPVSQTVWEGRQLVNAADRYNRVVQCGTQARSHLAIQRAVDYVRSGALGTIQYVIGTCYKARPAIGKLERPLQVANHINYDLWCGPVAKVDLYRPKLHYDWHWDYNTGNGDMGNQGIHQMDVARWFLGVNTLSPRVVSFGGRLGYDDAGNTANTQVVLHDYDEAPLIFETRGLPRSREARRTWKRSMDDYRGSRIGIVVQCEKGYVVSTDSYDIVQAYSLDDEVIQTWRGGGNHFANFLDAVRNRNVSELNAPVLEGHLSSALCHTGNISHMLGQPRTANEILESAGGNERLRDSLGRMFKHLRDNEIEIDQPAVIAGAYLEMDTKSERFTNMEGANALLHREDREPFQVPEVS